jgi:4-hydroxybenzoate polyprenyltransferase/phosphoserine phosphatase
MNTSLPLCVDLDGTLLKTDTLLELVVRVLKRAPWLALMLPIWLLSGKQVLKKNLASRCELDPSLLPLNPDFMSWLSSQSKTGRPLYLVTGAHESVARDIAAHHGFFTGVMATDDHVNLTGRRKAAKLVETFGQGQFAYAGNDSVDYPVWEAAGECVLVNASPSLVCQAKKRFNFSQIFDLRAALSLKVILKAMRLHQWAKNALVFVPLLAAHHLLDPHRFLSVVLAFIAFGCCASFSYIVNDIGDLDADRAHHSKFKRPFASGALDITSGLILALGLLFCAILFSLLLPPGFIFTLVCYFVITNLYTFRLKYIPILDVAILAGLYTMRVIAGGFAAQSDLSFWLLAFSCFVFFSLAIVKRVSELLNIDTRDGKVVVCRGYWTSDTPILTALGTASALMGVLVLALYINSPDIVMLYASPRYLWLVCPVLVLWFGRVWLITGRGQMHDDPVVFALRDRPSWLLFALAGAFLVIGALH